jgi:hypothetical protein
LYPTNNFSLPFVAAVSFPNLGAPQLAWRATGTPLSVNAKILPISFSYSVIK